MVSAREFNNFLFTVSVSHEWHGASFGRAVLYVQCQLKYPLIDDYTTIPTDITI